MQPPCRRELCALAKGAKPWWLMYQGAWDTRWPRPSGSSQRCAVSVPREGLAWEMAPGCGSCRVHEPGWRCWCQPFRGRRGCGAGAREVVSILCSWPGRSPRLAFQRGDLSFPCSRLLSQPKVPFSLA